MIDDRADAEALLEELDRPVGNTAGGRVATLVSERIATVNAAVDGGEANWQGWDITLESYIGGTNPQVGIRDLETFRSRNVNPWAGDGYVLGDAATQAQLDAWVARGNDLLKSIAEFSGYANETKLTTIVADTVKQTAADVKKIAVASSPWIILAVVVFLLWELGPPKKAAA